MPEQIADVLSNPEVVVFDDFNSLSDEKWWYAEQNVKVDSAGDGMVQLTGASPFATHLGYTSPLQEGQAALILFRYQGALPRFETHLELGEWQTASYRRFGLARWDAPEMLVNVWDGLQNRDEQGDFSSFSLTEGRWHYLLLAMGANGDFLLRLWDAQNPSRFAEYRQAYGESFNNREWLFTFKVDQGVMSLDSYAVISFGAYK